MALILKIVLYVLSGLTFILTLLPLLPLDYWWVRIGDFPRLQIAILGAALILAFGLFKRPFRRVDWIVAAMLSVCFVYQLVRIIPYTPFYPIEVERSEDATAERTLRLLISNVQIDHRGEKALLDLVRAEDPDLVLLAEPNKRWLDGIESLRNEYPHVLEKPQENAYGMALYSRLEMLNPAIRFLVEDEVPSIHTSLRLRNGKTLRFYGVHPKPPVPSETGLSTQRDAELVVVAKIIRKEKMPAIIAGDFNDVAWSRTTRLFQQLSGMLDPRIGRGMYNSFHADYPFMRFPLDHVFHTSHFRLVELRRLPSIGSDHFPLLAVLSLEDDAEATQDKPAAGPAELDEAEEMIEEAEEAENKDLPGGKVK